MSAGICAELGRCAYDAADEMMGDEPSQGCPWWSECFGVCPTPESGETKP